MFKRLTFAAVAAACAIGMIAVAPAVSAEEGGGTTYTWKGNTEDPTADNHSWSDEKNWEPNGTPEDGDSVVLELPIGRCAASIDGVPGVELKNFTMQGGGDSCGVSLSGSQNVTVTGLFQWNGGRIDVPMTMDGIGSIMGTSQKLKELTKTMEVTGTLTMTLAAGKGGLRIANPNNLHIKPGGTFISTGSNDITFIACCVNPARVINEGTVRITTGQLRITAVAFDQKGELKIGGGGDLLTTKAPITAAPGATYTGSGFWNIGDRAVARFEGNQYVESPFRIVLGGQADAPGGRLGGTFTLTGNGGRLDWLAGRIEGNMTVGKGFHLRAYETMTRRQLYGRDYTGVTPVPAVVLNQGTISFTDGAGYTGYEQSRIVNTKGSTLNLAPGTRIDAISCCTAPEKIVNEGGTIYVDPDSDGAALLQGVALEDANGIIKIEKGRQLQLVGGARSTLVSTSVSGGGRLLIGTPTKVSGTIKINAATNLALIHPGSIDGTATINGTGSTVWSGGAFSGNVTVSTVAGVSIYPTNVKFVNNVNGGSLASSLRFTVPVKIMAGTAKALNQFSLAQSKLIFAGTTTVPNFVEFYAGEVINTGTITFAAGTGGTIKRSSGEILNSGTAKIASGTLYITAGDYRQNSGSTDIAAGATVTTHYTANKVLITAGYLTGTGLIKTSLYNDKGVVSPGGDAAGTLRVTGTFTQGKTGTLRLDVAKSSRDRLTVDGNASIAGKLKFNTLGSAVPAVKTTQTLVTSKAMTLSGVCGYTAGAGSTTGKWVHSVSAGKNLVVVRQAGKDTTC